MIMVGMKKNIVLLLLLSVPVITVSCDPVQFDHVYKNQVGSHYENEMVDFAQDGMITGDEQIPKDLINPWAHFLAAVFKYPFVAMNKIYFWWYGTSRKSSMCR